MVRILLALIVTLSLLSPAIASTTDPVFSKWLDQFYLEKAAPMGISKETFERCFANHKFPDKLVIKRAQYQPEFSTPIWDYLEKRVTPYAVQKGQKLAQQYAKTLEQIEQQFGVSRYLLLAIWSMESNYGAVLKRNVLLHSIPQALATLAYTDPKRKKFATRQLLAILQLVEEKKVAPEQLLGSWAGAMGHTQFIPTSYIAYGVDFDQNGIVDLWNSVADALATSANLLAKNGWQTKRTWGYEVTSGNWTGDERVSQPLMEWQNAGFIRTGGRSFPVPQEQAKIVQLAGSENPTFLTIKNFTVIKRYNNSTFYALAVGLLADQIANTSKPYRKWKIPPGQLSHQEKKEVQRELQKRGLYPGEIDGLLGAASREAIRRFQQKQGIAITGLADNSLLQKLRKED